MALLNIQPSNNSNSNQNALAQALQQSQNVIANAINNGIFRGQQQMSQAFLQQERDFFTERQRRIANERADKSFERKVFESDRAFDRLTGRDDTTDALNNRIQTRADAAEGRAQRASDLEFDLATNDDTGLQAQADLKFRQAETDLERKEDLSKLTGEQVEAAKLNNALSQNRLDAANDPTSGTKARNAASVKAAEQRADIGEANLNKINSDNATRTELNELAKNTIEQLGFVDIESSQDPAALQAALKQIKNSPDVAKLEGEGMISRLETRLGQLQPQKATKMTPTRKNKLLDQLKDLPSAIEKQRERVMKANESDSGVGEATKAKLIQDFDLLETRLREARKELSDAGFFKGDPNATFNAGAFGKTLDAENLLDR